MNVALFTIILEAIKAFFEFFKIVVSRKQDIDKKKVVKEEKEWKEENDLKEAMHRALLSGDNTAIVLCLNRYNVMRREAKDESDSG